MYLYYIYIIFPILRKHKRIPENVSSTQCHTLSTMRNKQLIYLPSDKGKKFCVISRNTYNQLALYHLKDNNIYSEVTGIQSTQLKTLSIIIRLTSINKYKNNFITRNNKLPSFNHLIKTHKSDTTLQIRPIISSLEEPLNNISHKYSNLCFPPFQDMLKILKSSTN